MTPEERVMVIDVEEVLGGVVIGADGDARVFASRLSPVGLARRLRLVADHLDPEGARGA